MSFTITIKETKNVTRIEFKDYSITARKYISGNDYENLDYKEKSNWKRLEDGQYEYIEYGYPPKREVVKEEETKIFEQVIDKLNLRSVITAINSDSE